MEQPFELVEDEILYGGEDCPLGGRAVQGVVVPDFPIAAPADSRSVMAGAMRLTSAGASPTSVTTMGRADEL